MTKSIIARYIALPAVSAGILGGAALGLAGMANAGTYPTHDPSPRPGIVATPDVKAQPPVLVYPGHRWRQGGGLVIDMPLGGSE
jgi:hypothetical protein